MNAATITALCTGIAGILGSLAAVLHSMQTRKQANTPNVPTDTTGGK